MDIRRFSPEDLDDVVALNNAEVPRVSPIDVDGLLELLTLADGAYVATDEGQIAGFVLVVAPGQDYDSVNYRWFEARGTNHLYIDRIVVAPGCRRRGVGGALYDQVFAHAADSARQEITCEVNVDPPNEVSLAFHRARGFVEVGRQDAGHDDVVAAMLARPFARAGEGDAVTAARRDYQAGQLHESQLDPDPLAQLHAWFVDAGEAGVDEPTAVSLATVDAAGYPDVRTVLLRGIDEHGVRWFTNRNSTKGTQLAANPVAAISCHWSALERQVRLRGTVTELSDADSDAYFAARPRGAQIAAWASAQSQVTERRAALEAQVAATEERFAGVAVPRPPHWGGYLLTPTTVELWQGRTARLHDRVRYRRNDYGWIIERLQP